MGKRKNYYKNKKLRKALEAVDNQQQHPAPLVVVAADDEEHNNNDNNHHHHHNISSQQTTEPSISTSDTSLAAVSTSTSTNTRSEQQQQQKRRYHNNNNNHHHRLVSVAATTTAEEAATRTAESAGGGGDADDDSSSRTSSSLWWWWSSSTSSSPSTSSGNNNNNNKDMSSSSSTPSRTKEFEGKVRSNSSSFASTASSSSTNNTTQQQQQHLVQQQERRWGGRHHNNNKFASTTWNFHDRVDLIRYLKAYRSGAERVYQQQQRKRRQQQQATNREGNNDNQTSNDDDDNNKKARRRNDKHEKIGASVRVIGGVRFPQLTEDVFYQPYLALPSHLSTKQRKEIHECCVILDLHHMGVETTSTAMMSTIQPNDDNDIDNNSNSNNATNTSHDDIVGSEDERSTASSISGGGRAGSDDDDDDDDARGTTHRFSSRQRCILISIYADAFDDHEDGAGGSTLGVSMRNTTTIMKIRNYRPWFCRRRRRRIHRQVDDVDDTGSSGNNGFQTRIMVKDSMVDPQEAIRRIDNLIDQPGECIRDGDCDVLDWSKLEHASLNDVEGIREPAPSSPSPTKPTANGSSNVVDVSDGSWILVDTAEKMRQCIQHLQKTHPTEIAFDVEAYNLSKYAQLVCLLQLRSSYDDMEYVIDTLAPGVWDEVSGLSNVFSDPTIVKIGHSVGGIDIRCLHRDFGIYVVNVFDTYEAARILRLECGLGLTALCHYYGLSTTASNNYKQLKSLYQACDWRHRPLTEQMIRYGRYDVHYLILLRKLLMRDLIWGDESRIRMKMDPATRKREARLTAQALAATLRRIEHEEGDLVDEQQYMEAAETTGSIDDDDDDNDVSHQVGDISDDMISLGSTRSKNSSRRSIGTSDDEQYFSAESSIGIIDSDDDDDNGDDDDDDENERIMLPKNLRLQPRLMSALSRSQIRCRSSLWSGSSENHLQDKMYRNMRRLPDWLPSTTRLYDELVRWRDHIAQELEILSPFVAPLELLVAIAYKRPTNDDILRRIRQRLPEVLEDDNDNDNNIGAMYRSQLYAMMNKFNEATDKQDGTTKRITPLYYYHPTFDGEDININNRNRSNNDEDNNNNRKRRKDNKMMMMDSGSSSSNKKKNISRSLNLLDTTERNDNNNSRLSLSSSWKWTLALTAGTGIVALSVIYVLRRRPQR